MPILLGSHANLSAAVGFEDDPEYLSGGIFGAGVSATFPNFLSLAEPIEATFDCSSRALTGDNSMWEIKNIMPKVKASIIVALIFMLG